MSFTGVKTSGNRPLWLVGLMVIAWAMTLNASPLGGTLGALVLILSILILVILYPRYHIIDLAITWFGALYIGVLMVIPGNWYTARMVWGYHVGPPANLAVTVEHISSANSGKKQVGSSIKPQ